MINAYCTECKKNVRAVWGCDYSFEDYDLEGEGIVQTSTCSECDGLIETYMPEQPVERIVIKGELKL